MEDLGELLEVWKKIEKNKKDKKQKEQELLLKELKAELDALREALNNKPEKDPEIEELKDKLNQLLGELDGAGNANLEKELEALRKELAELLAKDQDITGLEDKINQLIKDLAGASDNEELKKELEALRKELAELLAKDQDITGLEDKLDQLIKDLAGASDNEELKKELEALRKELAELLAKDQDITGLEDKINQLIKELAGASDNEELKKELEALRKELAELLAKDQDITGLEDKLDQLIKDLAGASDNEELKKELEALRKELAELLAKDQDITGLEDKLDQLIKDLAGLSDNANLEKELEAIRKELAELLAKDQDSTELENKLDQLIKDLAGLPDNTKLEKELEKLREELAELLDKEQDITGLEDKLDQLIKDLAGADNGDFEKELEELRKNLGKILENTDGISQLDEKLNQLLGKLEEDNAKLVKELEELKKKLEDALDKLDKLDESMEELKKKLSETEGRILDEIEFLKELDREFDLNIYNQIIILPEGNYEELELKLEAMESLLKELEELVVEAMAEKYALKFEAELEEALRNPDVCLDQMEDLLVRYEDMELLVKGNIKNHENIARLEEKLELLKASFKIGALEEEDYTEASFEKVLEAHDKAETILENTQNREVPEIRQAIEDIEKAISELVFKSELGGIELKPGEDKGNNNGLEKLEIAGKEALREEILELFQEVKEEDEGKYTKESFAYFDGVRGDAEGLLEKIETDNELDYSKINNVTRHELQEMKDKLEAAIDVLEFKSELGGIELKPGEDKGNNNGSEKLEIADEEINALLKEYEARIRKQVDIAPLREIENEFHSDAKLQEEHKEYLEGIVDEVLDEIYFRDGNSFNGLLGQVDLEEIDIKYVQELIDYYNNDMPKGAKKFVDVELLEKVEDRLLEEANKFEIDILEALMDPYVELKTIKSLLETYENMDIEVKAKIREQENIARLEEKLELLKASFKIGALEEEDYTEASFKKVSEAHDKAETILENTQNREVPEIRQAIDDIEKAIDGLELKGQDSDLDQDSALGQVVGELLEKLEEAEGMELNEKGRFQEEVIYPIIENIKDKAERLIDSAEKEIGEEFEDEAGLRELLSPLYENYDKFPGYVQKKLNENYAIRSLLDI